MFVPLECLALFICIIVSCLTWYLGYCRGVKVGAEGMFDSLVEDDYLKVRELPDGEVQLIEPEWKNKQQNHTNP